MHVAPPPNPRELLPPLLACLPTAFISPRPPPALLPLVSPILRQRLSFLSGNNSGGDDNWLRLLSWETSRASRLPSVVENMQLEPHPVSGEIEIEDVRPAKYRRLDSETLHARLEVDQFDLLPTYVWCENDEHGGTGPGWKLTDLRSLEDKTDNSVWFDSLSQADDGAAAQPRSKTNGNSQSAAPSNRKQEEDDDDDYWAGYDRTPSQTPGQKPSPAPRTTQQAQMPAESARARSQSELDYFARYGNEVQPAMDAHDPDEEHPDGATSTLKGDALVREQARQNQHQQQKDDRPVQTSLYPADPPAPTAQNDISMPRPLSPSASPHSRSSRSSITKLEDEAAAMSDQRAQTQPGDPSAMVVDAEDAVRQPSIGGELSRAHLGIKQHISTDIKSLYRLAKSVGMERDEFERVVKRELEVLSFMDME